MEQVGSTQVCRVVVHDHDKKKVRRFRVTQKTRTCRVWLLPAELWCATDRPQLICPCWRGLQNVATQQATAQRIFTTSKTRPSFLIFFDRVQAHGLKKILCFFWRAASEPASVSILCGKTTSKSRRNGHGLKVDVRAAICACLAHPAHLPTFGVQRPGARLGARHSTTQTLM